MLGAIQLMEGEDFQHYNTAAHNVRMSTLISPTLIAHPGTAVSWSNAVSSVRSTSAKQRRPSSAILVPNQHASFCVKAKATVRLTQITVPTSQEIRSKMLPSSPAPCADSKVYVGISNMKPNIARPKSAARDESFEAASTIKFVDICREHDAADMNPDNMTTPFTRCSREHLKPALPRPGYVVAPAKMKIVVDLEKAIHHARESDQGIFNASEESIESRKFVRIGAILKVLKTLEQSMPKLETILSPVVEELEDFFGPTPVVEILFIHYSTP
jgi:hypothetical protein